MEPTAPAKSCVHPQLRQPPGSGRQATLGAVRVAVQGARCCMAATSRATCSSHLTPRRLPTPMHYVRAGTAAVADTTRRCSAQTQHVNYATLNTFYRKQTLCGSLAANPTTHNWRGAILSFGLGGNRGRRPEHTHHRGGRSEAQQAFALERNYSFGHHIPQGAPLFANPERKRLGSSALGNKGLKLCFAHIHIIVQS